MGHFVVSCVSSLSPFHPTKASAWWILQIKYLMTQERRGLLEIHRRLSAEMIMDIRGIMAVVGIFHQLLWYLLLYFNMTIPHSFSLPPLAWRQQFLKELLTITLFCSSFMPAAFIWSLLSSHSSVEMSSHTVSIWVPFEERLSASNNSWLLSVIS